MRPRKTLTLMGGLPRSGKSSVARRILLGVKEGVAIVCPDEVRKALGCYPFVADREPDVWRTVDTMIRALFGAGHDTVVLDATNVTRARRNQWRSADWDLCMVWVDVDAETCKARAREDGQDYLIPVIDRMALSMQVPNNSELPTLVVSRREVDTLLASWYPPVTKG